MDQATIREFAGKVSRYFLEFLESDFKKQRAPRRRIQIRTDTGLLAAMSLRRYPALIHAVRQLIERPVQEELELRIPRGKFLSPLSPTLKNLIGQHIVAIPDAAFENIRRHVLHVIDSTRGKAVEHPEVWVEDVIEALAESIATEVVRPVLTLLDGPLKQQAYSPVDSAFALEVDMVSLLVGPASGALPEALNTYLVTNDIASAGGILDDFLSATEGKRQLVAFFDAFGTADAYSELRDVVTYLHTGENLKFYLYFCTLSFGNQTFPLFYLPGTVDSGPDRAEYILKFEPHLYINKAAVDFIRQEKRSPTREVGDSPVNERILYLSESDTILGIAARELPGLCAALELPPNVDITSVAPQKARTAEMSLDNALLFAGFDRSDEALLNDYEELLVKLHAGSEDVTTLFADIIRGVIVDEPMSVRKDVDAVIDGLPLAARLVVESPIPLNDEQRRIRQALLDPHCRFIVVEGPPGTGKSHTITALAFDAILQQKSTLILSDKTEALDVVEDKLGKTMSTVRGDQNFQNPILRLGRQGANFRRLVSGASLAQIQAHHRAQVANKPLLDAELKSVIDGLSRDIEKTALSLSGLKMRRLAEHVDLELRLRKKYGGSYIEALQRVAEDAAGVAALAEAAIKVTPKLVARFADLAGVGPHTDVVKMHKTLRLVWSAAALRQQAPASLTLLKPMTEEAAKKCLALYWRFTALRQPVIGYLFRRPAVEAVEHDLYATGFLVKPIMLRKQRHDLYAALTFLLDTAEHLEERRIKKTDLSELHAWVLKTYDATGFDSLMGLLSKWYALCKKESVLMEGHGHRDAAFLECLLVATRYISDRAEISTTFRNLPNLDYLADKSRIELLCTSRMTSIVDGRFLEFADNQRAKMRSLAGVISQRAKFPADHFDALRNAFPVILASIREFAEYMPLAHNLFDLVIIDEGSQVSVAQALPAILRARKVVVFGDSRQFSNVKSANASNERNNAYRSDLKQFFIEKVAKDAARLQRLSVFNVKTSVLDFFQLCANFSIMLRKHFRGPQELISFSSEQFYGGQLQAIKVRTQPMEDVLRFNVVPLREGGELIRNVNQAEATFIVSKLEAMLEDEEPPTVGVITPFREQQQYITRELIHHPRWEDFKEKLHIKVRDLYTKLP